MKKIAFVLHHMNIGGVEKSFLNMLNLMNDSEYEVTLFLFQKQGVLIKHLPPTVKVVLVQEYELIKNDVYEHPVKNFIDYLKTGRLIKSIKSLYFYLCYKISGNKACLFRSLLRKHKDYGSFDVAIAYDGPYDLISAFVLYCLNSDKKIQWIHFDVASYNFNIKTSKTLYSKFSEVYAVSKEARDSLVEKIPELSARTYVLKNFVDESTCIKLANESRAFIDDFYGIRLLTVGRLSEEKGQEIIPSIVYSLKCKGYNVKWHIIGEGSLKESIITEIRKYSVENEVVLEGAKFNPYPYFNETDIYVQTSKHEGFCLTLAEAKVFKKPIVSTKCAGAEEQLLGVENSYIVTRNIAEIENAIINIIHSKELM